MVYVAEHDPLHDEGVAYAKALANADVPVVLDEADGQMHGYLQMAKILPGYDEGMQFVTGYLNQFIASFGKEV
ncbi:hypothetical protein GCM10027563_48490 [Parasphingorhabdus pacifica]